MNQRALTDEAFEEACYRAWRQGLDPDAVSRERIASDCVAGEDPEHVAARELARLRAIAAARGESE